MDELTELDPVRWLQDAPPRARAAVEPALELAGRVVTTAARAAGQLELGLERLLMDPGPPSPWARQVAVTPGPTGRATPR